MNRPIHWLACRGCALRRAANRGATLVEYALVASLLLVGVLAVLDRLTEAADSEVNNQALCVSDRPPPTVGDDQCAFAPVPDDVITPDPDVVPPTTAPPVPNTDLYTVQAQPAADEGPAWTIVLPVSVLIEVQEPPTDPVGAGGIRVSARVQMKDPNNLPNNLPDPGFTECITDAMGQCELRYTVPYPDVQDITMLVTGVEVPNPPTDLPPMISRTRPPGM